MSKNELILAFKDLKFRFNHMKCIKRDDQDRCINSIKKFISQTYEVFAKYENESLSRIQFRICKEIMMKKMAME
jgi:hypothetical protein